MTAPAENPLDAFSYDTAGVWVRRMVAAAAGRDVSGVGGADLVFNTPRPVVPGLLISRPVYTLAARRALRGQ